MNVGSLTLDLISGADPALSVASVRRDFAAAFNAGNRGSFNNQLIIDQIICMFSGRQAWPAPDLAQQWCGYIANVITHRCHHVQPPVYQPAVMPNAPVVQPAFAAMEMQQQPFVAPVHQPVPMPNAPGMQPPFAAMESQQPFVAPAHAGPAAVHNYNVNQLNMVVHNAPVMQMAPPAMRRLLPGERPSQHSLTLSLEKQSTEVAGFPAAERAALVRLAKQRTARDVPVWAANWANEWHGLGPMLLCDYADCCASKFGDEAIGSRGNSKAWATIAILLLRGQWEAGKAAAQRRHRKNISQQKMRAEEDKKKKKKKDAAKAAAAATG